MLRGRLGRLGLTILASIGLLGCATTTATPEPSPSEFSSAVPSLLPTASMAPTAPQTAIASESPASTTPSPAPETTAPTTPTSPPVTPTPTPPPAGPLMVDWQQVDNPGLPSAYEIHASAAGNVFLAVGSDHKANAVIWWSNNGHDWQAGDLPSASSSNVYDVSVNGNGYIAVGAQFVNGSTTAMALTSADGRTWQVLSAASIDGWSYGKVAVVGSNVVVGAYDPGSGESGFVVSHDGGASWGPVAQPEPSGSKTLLALTTADHAFWAFSLGPAKGAQIEIWRSADGDSWTSVGTLPALANTGALNVAAGPLGWVAVARGFRNHREIDSAWWSADGMTWQSAQPAPFGVEDIFADDAGFVAVGNYYPQGAGCGPSDPSQAEGLTFTSADGSLWRRMPTQGWQGKYIAQLRRFNRTLIGIGVDFSTQTKGTGAIWTAKLPHASSDSGPVPTNPPLPAEGC